MMKLRIHNQTSIWHDIILSDILLQNLQNFFIENMHQTPQNKQDSITIKVDS
jgi:hypothetical protein